MSEAQPVRAWLSLGSNISPRKQIPAAVDALATNFGELVVSPVYESEAVGFTGDNFHNLVVGIETCLPPRALLQLLRQMEETQGRVRGADKFAPRTIDIDLLTYGDSIIDDGDFQLPRGEILRFAFVLQPLTDVAGDERHPQTGSTYREHLKAFEGSDQFLWRVDEAESQGEA
jgi:2-amino-4-hydroxy-6-hydroxymethyldihydropteridine diphosphokinase